MKARVSTAPSYLNSTHHRFQTITEEKEKTYIVYTEPVKKLEFNINEKLENVPQIFQSGNNSYPPSPYTDPYQTFTIGNTELVNNKINHMIDAKENENNLSYIITRDETADTVSKEMSAVGGDSGQEVVQNGQIGWEKAMVDKKDQSVTRLQDELQKAHEELKLKDEEVLRLTRIKGDVERELEELTASLFEEAHKMVREANEKQAAAEKALAESQMKVDVLSAEVTALKTLVLTSTPSRPNPHLHPQISKDDTPGGVNLFNRKHRRSPSHFNLKYGRENSPPDSPVKDQRTPVPDAIFSSADVREAIEVDPNTHKEFLNWRQNAKLDKNDPFIARIYKEDIDLCLAFNNADLSVQVKNAIESRDIFIEAVTDKTKTVFPKKCALLEIPRQCHYRMRIGSQENWYSISQICRNRIIAVCEFVNYLRYIELGLVKSSVHDIYWEITRLRKEMILARLGLSLSTN